MQERPSAHIAMTTVSTADEARKLARGAIEKRLAACAQIEGPIQSHYLWEGVVETSDEYRIVFKCLDTQLDTLSRWLHTNHSYDTPEWIVLSCKEVSEKYLIWMQAIAN